MADFALHKPAVPHRNDAIALHTGIIRFLREGLLSLKRHMLCALLVIASSTAAFAANDGVPTSAPGSTPGTTQSAGPALPQAGTNAQTDAPGTRACRHANAKSRPQLTPEQKAQRKAARQAMHTEQAPQGAAQGIPKAHKPHPAKSPVC